jgi:hypothetical protein
MTMAVTIVAPSRRRALMPILASWMPTKMMYSGIDRSEEKSSSKRGQVAELGTPHCSNTEAGMSSGV